MNIEELINLIEKAFDGVPQPEDITLHVAEAHDDYDYDHDKDHRRKDYVGRWQDVPKEHIEKCQSALSFVNKTGMRFYLPAYMVWCLKNFGSDEVCSDHTLYSLDNHAKDPKLAEYHKERFSLFTPKQLKACAAFVKFCANDETDFTDAYFAKKNMKGTGHSMKKSNKRMLLDWFIAALQTSRKCERYISRQLCTTKMAITK